MIFKTGPERQRQHRISFNEIKDNIEQDDQGGHTLLSRVQVVEELSREISGCQHAQAQSLRGIERNMIQYHEMGGELSRQPLAMDAALNQSLDHHCRQSKSFQNLEKYYCRSNLAPTSTALRMPLGESEGYSQPSVVPHNTGNRAMARNVQKKNEASSYTAPIQRTKKRCDSACGCGCYQRSQLKSPRILSAPLGSLV